MSMTMAKADGVTVFTLTSDPNSDCPLLCQLFKGLCYNPVCCSVSQPLRRLQGTSQSVLGALQIMIGVLNIGLAAILYAGRFGTMEMYFIGFPFWLGPLFMLFGIMCILSEKFPSPCLVIINVILNLVGVAFAITAIVLYSANAVDRWFGLWNGCQDGIYYWDDDRRTTLSPEDLILIDKCLAGHAVTEMLLRSINILLIVLSVMEFCIVVSVIVLGIKALKKTGKGETKEPENPEFYKPLLEEVLSNPTV